MNTKIFLMNLFYRYGFWILISVFTVSVASLVICIRNVIRLEEKNLLYRLPPIEEQKVDFSEAGRVILSVEGPQFTHQFAGLSYELQASDGTIITGGSTGVFFRQTNISKVKLKIHYFPIPQAGEYIFRIHGLPEEPLDTDTYQIIFSKPHYFKTIGYIVGITLSAVFIIGSLVVFILFYPTPGTVLK